MQGLKLLKSRYFRKLYLTFSGFFLLVLLGISFLVSHYLSETIYQNELASMKEKLALFVPQAKRVFASDNYEGAQSIFPAREELSYVRFTLIVPRGELIADSHNLNDTTVEGWNRPEILKAISSPDKTGIARRYSPVYQEELLLMAKLVEIDGKVAGVVRADVPASAMKTHISQIIQVLSWIAAFCVLTAFAMGFIMARSIAAPISQMAEVCRDILNGDYHSRVTYLPRDEVGRLGRTVNLLSKVVLDKLTAMAHERAQLKSILTVMNEGIISVNSVGEVSFCNRNAYTLLGSSEVDVRGLHLSEIEGFKVLEPIAEAVLQKKKFSKKSIRISISAENGTMSERYLDVFAAYYKTKNFRDADFGEVEIEINKGAILVVNDTTDFRKLETIRRDFIANVSHELKTPLTSIRGYVETLLAGAYENPKFAKRFIEKIESNADRLTNLVYDLLSLAKIEDEDSKVDQRAIQWAGVIHKTLERYESLISGKNIAVELVKEHSRQAVIGEQEGMSTVFENLLTNAIRYSPEGGHIKIWFEKAGDMHKMHVTDTGIGISKDNLPRVFERFYRADKARSREEGGTGLGLSIVKHLVVRMGGTIDVESAEGIGSTFTVSLPKAF